jgi:hypothetical protein
MMAILLAAAATSTSVEYDHQADFSRYGTWSWSEKVTRAMNPVTDKRIREAIESGLATRGLSRVDANATLVVAYHASKTSQLDLPPIKNAPPPPAADAGYFEKGALVVDMADAASGAVVWRGRATGVLRYGPNEIAEQVKGAIDKLLESFPPPAAAPSPR